MFLTLLIAFLSLIALMIIHEFGHFIIAKKFKVRIDEFGIGYPPRLFGKKFGETIYSINLVPLGAFVKIYGEEGGIDDYRSFSRLTVWKRILIVLGGVISFWLASMVVFAVAFLIGVSVPIGDQDVVGVTSTNIKVISVVEGSPAEKAGVKPGDSIVKAQVQSQDAKIDKVAQFQAFVQDNKGKQVNLILNRSGENLSVALTPRTDYPEGQGPTGIVLERVADIIKKHTWYQSPLQGIIYTGKITWQAISGIYAVISNLARGQGMPEGAELAGPVGITIFLSQAATLGTGFFLYFIGSLSVLLALFNLLPIPALDGGKFLFLIIEFIRKKPVSARIEQTLTAVFFILLITMSVFVTAKFDIPRVVDFWKAGL